jgi:hypothetical protein
MFVKGVSTDNFIKFDLAGLAHMMIFNDNSTNELAYSYDGNSLDGVVFPNEGLEFEDLNQAVIYVKSYVAGSPVAFRIFSFGDPNIIYLSQNQPSFNQNSRIPNTMNTTEPGFSIPQKKGVH